MESANEESDSACTEVLSVPVVIGPWVDTRLTGSLDNGKPVCFEFCGKDTEDVEAVKRRTVQAVSGYLDGELNATVEEIRAANFHMAGHA